MTKLTTISTAALVGVFALSACGSGAVEEQQETINIRVGTANPASHPMWAGFVEPIIESVEEKTEGQVQFETFTGGQLVEYQNEIAAVESGVVDLAMFFPVLEPDRMPMGEITFLPAGQYSSEVATEAWINFFYDEEPLSTGDTIYDEMATNNDIELIPLQSTESYRISAVGSEPGSLNEFQELTLRTPSPIHSILSEELGIGSTTVSITEMYDALNRGTFDGTYQPMSDWGTYGVDELWDYTYDDIGLGAFPAAVAMTTEFWDGLPENVQEAFDEAWDENLEGAIQLIDQQTEEMREANASEGGVFLDLEQELPEVHSALGEATTETWLRYIENLNDSGFDGNELADRWRTALVDAGAEIPESVQDLDLD